MKNVSKFLPAILILVFMAGCSSQPKPATEAKPAEEKKTAAEPTYITGRDALQKMYIAARSWAPDAKPYNIVSLASKNNPGKDGKSGIWFAGFASPSKRSSKIYTWSGIEAEGAPDLGVSFKPEDEWSPANSTTQIFDLNFLKTDSDNAFKEAQEHGGDKLMKKSPDTLVLYKLDWNARENQLIWHVLYGANRDNPQLRIAVDATGGKYIRVER